MATQVEFVLSQGERAWTRTAAVGQIPVKGDEVEPAPGLISEVRFSVLLLDQPAAARVVISPPRALGVDQRELATHLHDMLTGAGWTHTPG